jgi:hypothetical protein
MQGPVAALIGRALNDELIVFLADRHLSIEALTEFPLWAFDRHLTTINRDGYTRRDGNRLFANSRHKLLHSTPQTPASTLQSVHNQPVTSFARPFEVYHT